LTKRCCACLRRLNTALHISALRKFQLIILDRYDKIYFFINGKYVYHNSGNSFVLRYLEFVFVKKHYSTIVCNPGF
ncbi:MAG: hypothetical protein ACPMAG_08430, partial [Limisphaerales bacterium]